MKKLALYIIPAVCFLYSCKSHTVKQTGSSSAVKAPVYNKDSINRKDSSGRRQGIWVVYSKNGLPLTESHYKDNCLEGTCKAFDENGNVNAEIQYNRDTLDGEYRYFSVDGKPYLTKFYMMGILKAVKRYTTDGKVESIQVYDKDGNLIGNESAH